MKVTVERAQLLKSLSHVHRVVERRNTIPILANVLIRGERGKLAFKATDLDLEMIETAGLGVAMGDAPEGVRARADYVCGSADEEGLREVLERFVLGSGS